MANGVWSISKWDSARAEFPGKQGGARSEQLHAHWSWEIRFWRANGEPGEDVTH